MSVNRTYFTASGEPYKSMSEDTNGLFINDLNKGDNDEAIKLNNHINTGDKFDYEVYTIQNPTKPSEMLKICVRKVGDLPETSPISNWSNEPQMPSVISNYLGNKEIGPNASPKLGLESIERKNTGWWAATLEYKERGDGNDYAVFLTVDDTDHPDNRYDMKTYKKHLKKFNNYNLEIRIHPDYEDTYKFAIGTKDNKPKTGTRVYNRWYFNRLLQLPIHESQIDNTTGGPKANHGLSTLESFFKFNSNPSEILTYPNDAMDYLYFYTADSSNTDQPQDDLKFKFKANWAEIVTELYKDPECGRYNESRFTCTAQTQPGFRSGNAPTCLYSPKVHCTGEWRDPPTVLDDYGDEKPNRCGLVQPGVEIKQYVELSAGKLDAINDVWNPGNYQSIIGAQCEDEDIGWLVYTDLDASASGHVATDTFRTKTIDGSDNPKYDPNRELPKGITGTPAIGTWKRAVPKHGDLKYVACSTDCVEETLFTSCETPGVEPSISPNYSGTFDERRRMNFVVPEDTPYDTPMEELANSYDFSNAWYASENSCSGNFTNYKSIKTSDDGKRMLFAQGEYGKACPSFSLEQSRGNFGSFESFDAYGNFTRGGACTLPKQNCIAGSSCIVNTDKITKLVGRINRGEHLVKINNGTANDDVDSLEIEIDGTRYNKQNNITEEILFRLAKKECDRFSDLYGFPNKAFCTEDKEIYISETPGVPPCEYKTGSCYVDERKGEVGAGINVFYLDKTEGFFESDGNWNDGPRISTKFIKPFEFCKWIDMPDLPSE
jgi:hypothetical protein